MRRPAPARAAAAAVVVVAAALLATLATLAQRRMPLQQNAAAATTTTTTQMHMHMQPPPPLERRPSLPITSARGRMPTCARDYEPCAGGLPSPVLRAPCCNPGFFCFRRGAYFSQCRPRDDAAATAAARLQAAAALAPRTTARRHRLCAPAFGVCAAGPGADSRIPCCNPEADACVLDGPLFHQCMPRHAAGKYWRRGQASQAEADAHAQAQAGASAVAGASAFAGAGGTYATAAAYTSPGAGEGAYAGAGAVAGNSDGSVSSDSVSTDDAGPRGRHNGDSYDYDDGAWYLLPHGQPPRTSGGRPRNANSPFPFSWPPALPGFTFLTSRESHARGYVPLSPRDKLLPLLVHLSPNSSLATDTKFTSQDGSQRRAAARSKQESRRWFQFQRRASATHTVVISAVIPALSSRRRLAIRQWISRCLPASTALVQLRGGNIRVSVPLADFWDAAMGLAALPYARHVHVDQGFQLLADHFGREDDLARVAP